MINHIARVARGARWYYHRMQRSAAIVANALPSLATSRNPEKKVISLNTIGLPLSYVGAPIDKFFAPLIHSAIDPFLFMISISVNWMPELAHRQLSRYKASTICCAAKASLAFCL